MVKVQMKIQYDYIKKKINIIKKIRIINLKIQKFHKNIFVQYVLQKDMIQNVKNVEQYIII